VTDGGDRRGGGEDREEDQDDADRPPVDDGSVPESVDGGEA
jgi:hypothetical protein